MEEVRVTLLGGFVAQVGGKSVSANAWRLRKARELVKMLALAPRQRLHREQLMDVLWPDRDPASAANNLYQAVHAARRALGAGALEVRDECLHLRAEVDVVQFEHAALDARRASSAPSLRAALALFGGELLPENLYDDWTSTRRDELERLRADLETRLARLGAAASPSGLPADASSFVGRAHELAELRTLLTRTRLLTLAGSGGAGKTRLALQLARGAQSGYADGAALVELSGVASPERVVQAVAVAFDVRALPGHALLDATTDFLAVRSVLLVLDNCEHVLGASAALADEILRRAPRVTILATSREPLRVAGEVVFRVPSLALPEPEKMLPPTELLNYEAVQLFVERARAAAPAFQLENSNAADVVQICVRLDGLPLALELAAARLGALSPRSIAERLDNRFRILRSGSRAAPSRQQTLAATLQWSHELLKADERALLRRLAVFAGTFELSAVEAVCADSGLPAIEIADLLARLVEKSLVSIDDVPGSRRYRLLETVRFYAHERLHEQGEEQALAMCHAQWALALMEGQQHSSTLDRDAANLRLALDTLAARDPGAALRFCVAAWPFWLRRIDLAEAHRRLVAALAAAPAHVALRVDALHAAAAIDFRAGSLGCGRAHAHEALRIARELGDPFLEWRSLYFLGNCTVAGDDPHEGEAWFRPALELARRGGFATAEALTLYSLGVGRWQLDDLDGAESCVGQSVALLRAVPEEPGTGLLSPANIAEFVVTTPERPGPRLYFEETLQQFIPVGRDAALGYALANQAALARCRGDFPRARALLDESEACFARIDEPRGSVDILARRASLELAAGSLMAARELLLDALSRRRRANDRRGLGLLLTGLGHVETTAGELQLAECYLAEARDLFRRAGDRWGLIAALWRTADLAIARHDLAAAELSLAEGLHVAKQTERDRWIAFTLVALAEVAALRDARERAATLLREAQSCFEARHDRRAAAAVTQALAGLEKPVQSSRKGSADTLGATR